MAQLVDALPVQSTVVKQGLLRKVKTMKKRYFVLHCESPDRPARLEYYASEKKFKDGKSQPRKTLELHSCLCIGATARERVSFAIALHTRDDWLAVGFDSESERDEWLATMHQLVGSSKFGGGGDVSVPMFEHVWTINLRPKGLGRGLAGFYRLCLTDRTLSLVKRATSEATLTFPLEVMRRCGHTDNFFFVEVGRQASTGEGELWMEAEDALIAQSAHYAVQRAMHATKDGTVMTNLVPGSASVSLPASASAATTAAAAVKAPDAGPADQRHGSVSSRGNDSSTARRPEAEQSPPQTSRFSTGALSLLTRRLSSKSKSSSVPPVASTPPVSSSSSAGGTADAVSSDERSAAPSGAGSAAAQRDTRLLSVSRNERPAATAALAAAADGRRNSSSWAVHHDAGAMAARSGSPMPAIEITAVAADPDDPYFDMSVNDHSGSGGLTARTDYMEMTPRSAAAACSMESTPNHTSADGNYLAMLPGNAAGSAHSSPRVAHDDLPHSDASLSFAKVQPTGGPPRSPRYHPRDSTGGSNGRPAPKGSQQLLPDLFSLTVSVGCAGSAPSAGPDGLLTSWSPAGSTASCNSPSAYSLASLSVPTQAILFDTDRGGGASCSGGTRLRTGSDAPTHRRTKAAAAQRVAGGRDSGCGSGPPLPDQRQRSSSHGCVVTSLDSVAKLKLDTLRQTAVRGLSDSKRSVGQPHVDGGAESSLPGSFEYVAMDFGSEPPAAAPTAVISPTAAASSKSFVGQLPPAAVAAAAAATCARADLKLPPPGTIAIEDASSGASVVVAMPSSRGSAELGDYVGIDFAKAPAVAVAGNIAADSYRRSSCGTADSCRPAKPSDTPASPAGHLMSEPFPELSCSVAAVTAVPERQWHATPSVRHATVSHAHSRSRDSSLGDGLHLSGSGSHFVPAAGGVAGQPLTLAVDDRSNIVTDEAAYVMFSRTSAHRSVTERPTVAVAPALGSLDAYAELDVGGSAGRSLSNDTPGGSPLSLPPQPALGFGSARTAAAPSVSAAAMTRRASGDSYDVMNFSPDAQQQQRHQALLPPQPPPSGAKVSAPGGIPALASEQLPDAAEPAAGDSGAAAGRPGALAPGRPPPPSAAASLAASMGTGVQMPNGVAPGAGSGSSSRPSSAFMEAMAQRAAANRLAVPVRATCYIKDDSDDDSEGGSGSSGNGPTGDRLSATASSNGLHSQKSKAASGSRGTLAAAAGTGPIGSGALPAVTAQPPLLPPPPVPDKQAPPTSAIAATGKLRHASGSDLAMTVINYATLDLEPECPPRTVTSAPAMVSVAAAATSLRPISNSSSSGSLVLFSSEGAGSGARSPPMPAGSGVQYSRIDFAKIEALKAGKT